MKETHVFLVPDYYPDFKCKMGACRNSCCEGWPVTISLDDYFKLLSLDCNSDLRSKLDTTLHILSHPTPDEYAEISHDYTGQCRLRLPDGRCALHAEAGEDALSPLCRLYPRGVRSEGDYECSCACSCEETLELLLKKDGSLSFIPYEMTIDVPDTSAPTVFFETVGREQEIRLHFIRLIQNRDYPLNERLIHLTQAIRYMEKALAASNEADVEALLHREYSSAHDIPEHPTEEQLAFGLEIAEELIEVMDERSTSLRDYGNEALSFFKNDPTRYHEARTHFETLFPNWQDFFENMLANHMFFSRFPFQDRPDSLSAEKDALDAIYALLRFTGIGCMANSNDPSRYIDICHALFRLIDHTEFDRYAGRILDRLCSSEDQLLDLLSL